MRYAKHRTSPYRTPAIVALLAGLAAVLTVACGSAEGEPTPIDPAPSPTAAGSGEVTADPTSAPYDSNLAMYRVFPGFGLTSQNTFAALEEVRDAGDTSLVPVLVETMRFQSSRRSREATAEVLQELTGQDFGSGDWNKWMEWLGRHRGGFPPPDGYADWKADIMAQIDPRFRGFLAGADETTRVDLTEVVWGGVLPDGIPDLRNPPNIPPAEADYLTPDDRVFGVSINGESRAYPLRITNAHEMVNDVLGGEPISLSW